MTSEFKPETDSQDLTEKPVSHATTTGMTGGGFYNANSAPQWLATERVLSWLDEAVAGIPLSGDGPIAMADFGCSEGKNSVAVLARVVEHVLPRTDKPVQTIHSDLPTNDFSALFKILRPKGRSVFGSERVFSAVVGGSMYDQLLPDNSLHLAMTFNAIGFLSRRPVSTLPGYIFPNGPSSTRGNGFVSDEDRNLFAEQAKADVASFLTSRARELVAGGKLLVQVFGSVGDTRTCDGIYDLLNDAVLEFVESGEISREVYGAYYQPVYMRHLEELTAVVAEVSDGASPLFSIDRSQAYEIEVPFNRQYQTDGDRARYAKDYVNFFRAFTEAVLRNALPDTPDRADLVNRVYERAGDLLVRSPDKYPFRYAAIAMLLTRNR